MHFLWTSCFAIVWPFGTIFTLMNQLLELRFDALKMLHVRGRRFPNSHQMCDVWVPLCSQIICYVSIAVNIVLALIPYRQYQMWIYDADAARDTMEPFLVQGTWQKLLTAFAVLSLLFAAVRLAAVAAARCCLSSAAPPRDDGSPALAPEASGPPGAAPAAEGGPACAGHAGVAAV
ncbi:unnamed protein product [Prorocentrum cordatum]|uniref:Anoctamin transmembrane domain-containing protein n=1 Tax=Prorocentrum cordatum TaxID=2364126 RepID=A0ABN9RE37_9DINO|nr:unnamed protein product [Polarella glacialis]